MTEPRPRPEKTLRRAPALFDVLPTLARGTPWTPLAHAPTPVSPCDALADWLGHGGVYVKRDDAISPLYGGNKVRRYELVLAAAAAKGATRLVTCGGLGSTQVMATAILGAALGFDTTAVLFDQPMTAFVRTSLLCFGDAGLDVVYGGGYAATALRLATELARRGSALILPGAASPLANLGYVDAMLELAAQVERGEAPRPDVIVLPTGSAGTLAGLALGAAFLGWPTEIVGVRIASPIACNRATVARVIAGTDRLLSRDPRWIPRRDAARFTLDGTALGAGYGHPTPEARDAAARLEALTGTPGEVTYSGKALAALRARVRAPGAEKKTFLFWNTLSSRRPTEAAGAIDRLPRALRRVLDRPLVA